MKLPFLHWFYLGPLVNNSFFLSFWRLFLLIQDNLVRLKVKLYGTIRNDEFSVTQQCCAASDRMERKDIKTSVIVRNN